MDLEALLDGYVPPSVDVCAICGDSDCDGVACYAALDPNDLADQPQIEQVQDWIRRGRAQECAERILAEAHGLGYTLEDPDDAR